MPAVMLISAEDWMGTERPRGALTAARDTPARTGEQMALTQGSNTIYRGAMTAVDGSGLAVAASDASGLKVVGRAAKTSDNTGSSYVANQVAGGRWMLPTKQLNQLLVVVQS
jgi:hypothetical protein